MTVCCKPVNRTFRIGIKISLKHISSVSCNILNIVNLFEILQSLQIHTHAYIHHTTWIVEIIWQISKINIESKIQLIIQFFFDIQTFFVNISQIFPKIVSSNTNVVIVCQRKHAFFIAIYNNFRRHILIISTGNVSLFSQIIPVRAFSILKRINARLLQISQIIQFFFNIWFHIITRIRIYNQHKIIVRQIPSQRHIRFHYNTWIIHNIFPYTLVISIPNRQSSSEYRDTFQTPLYPLLWKAHLINYPTSPKFPLPFQNS